MGPLFHFLYFCRQKNAKIERKLLTEMTDMVIAHMPYFQLKSPPDPI